MAIKYKALERGEPGVAGGGNKQWYASTITQGERDIDQLTKSIEKISTVSGADIRGVLYALVDVITDDLGNGLIVRLGDLGSMRVSLGSDGVATAEEVTASIIRDARTIFTPGAKLKNMLKTLEYKKA